MLQLDVALCRTRDNVAHKVRRYIHFFVALGGVISTKRSITPPKEFISDVGWSLAPTLRGHLPGQE